MNKDKVKLYKALVLDEEIDKQVAKACNRSFRLGDISGIEEVKAIYGEDVFKVAKGINHSRYARTKRVRSKVEDIVLTDCCIFVTLTFTDGTLSKTNEKTRRVYVSRYLKKNALVYVANVDYGKTNEREHYHALVLSHGLDLEGWRKYGAINVERVGKTNKDLTRVSKYVAKLSNHALKHKNGSNPPRLIYSRGAPRVFGISQ